MAARCATCGRSDLMQPDVANYQCLACGALTDIATEQVVPTSPTPPKVSNAGLPVVELSTGIVVADATGDDRRDRTVGDDVSINETEPEVKEEVAPRPARVDESYVPAETGNTVATPEETPAPVETDVFSSTPTPEEAVAPEAIDLSTLTAEQIAAIEEIAHPGA